MRLKETMCITAPVPEFSQNTGRRLSIDLIKAISMVMVIITHVAGISQEVRNVLLWPYTVLPAVPLFLMASVYTFSMAEDCTEGTVLTWFQKDRFYRRSGRFVVPWIFTILIQIILLFLLLNISKIDFLSIVKIVVIAGRGPGAYYVMIVLQLMVIFPFMKYAFDKSPFSAAVLFLGIQVIWEYLCRYVQIPSIPYNYIILRFFSNLVLGFLFYKYYDSLQQTAIPLCCLIIGGGYLLNTYYREYTSVLTMSQGNRTMVAGLYSFWLFYCLMQLEPICQKYKKLLTPIFYIGKASFHIMLTQMTYFYFARNLNFESRFEHLLVRMVVDVVISLTVGCLFFWLDETSRKFLKRKAN